MDGFRGLPVKSKHIVSSSAHKIVAFHQTTSKDNRPNSYPVFLYRHLFIYIAMLHQLAEDSVNSALIQACQLTDIVNPEVLKIFIAMASKIRRDLIKVDSHPVSVIIHPSIISYMKYYFV